MPRAYADGVLSTSIQYTESSIQHTVTYLPRFVNPFSLEYSVQPACDVGKQDGTAVVV